MATNKDWQPTSIARRSVLLGLSATAATLAAPWPAAAASLASTFRPKGSASVDHGAWDQLLRAYVRRQSDSLNLVDYGGFKSAGRSALTGYIKQLESVTASQLSKSESMAYWINLYNAKTIDVVLSRYPVKSIKEINLGGGFFGRGPWRKKLVTVEGHELSLDNIEHDILRKNFKDARIHYAVNCASYSCPNLAATAYTSGNLNALLSQGGRDYVNHDRGVRVDGSSITASKIYSWYAGDFGGKRKLKAHWNKYAENDKKNAINAATSIAGYDYDWSLNDVR